MIRRVAKAVTIAVAVSVPGISTVWSVPAGGEQNKTTERARFVGVWKGFAVDGKGETPDRGPVKLELTITERRIHGIEIRGDERIDHGEGEFTLNLDAEPHHLDGTQTNERGREKTYLGIYSLDGDTLRWCVSPRKERPTTFETVKGQFLLILKRAGDTTETPELETPPASAGFVSLFNGKDLTGWEGDRRIWSVQDGAITGHTTAEVRVTENDFLIWREEVEDFELRLKFRLEGGNSGIYIRARKRPPGQKGEALAGMQADFSADGRWTGVIMEYTLREVLAERGQKVTIDTSGKKTVIGSLGDPKKLLDVYRPGEWNHYRVLARGGRITIAINGTVMADLDDRDPKRLKRGWLALQVHTGPPMRVQFREVLLRRY